MTFRVPCSVSLRPSSPSFPQNSISDSSRMKLYEIFSVCWGCSVNAMVKLSVLYHRVRRRYAPNKGLKKMALKILCPGPFYIFNFVFVEKLFSREKKKMTKPFREEWTLISTVVSHPLSNKKIYLIAYDTVIEC